MLFGDTLLCVPPSGDAEAPPPPFAGPSQACNITVQVRGVWLGLGCEGGSGEKEALAAVHMVALLFRIVLLSCPGRAVHASWAAADRSFA